MLVQERPLPDQSRRMRGRAGRKNIHGRRLDSETLRAERPLYRGPSGHAGGHTSLSQKGLLSRDRSCRAREWVSTIRS
jgi:hypothetical protein